MTRDGEWISDFGLAHGVFKRKTILLLLVAHLTESDRSTDAVVEVMWGALDPRAAPLETASSLWLKGRKGSTRLIPRTTLPHGHEST